MLKFIIWITALALLLAFTITACAPTTQQALPTQDATEPLSDTGSSQSNLSGNLVIYSGRSEPLIQPVIDAFRADHPGVEVLLKAGSNSEIANALIEEKNNPQADIFVTTELFTIQSLASQDIFQPYLPVGTDQLPEEFIGPEDNWIGLTRRARVIMYNTELVTAEEAPKSIFDLTDPKWRGQVAAAGSTNGSMQAQIAVLRGLIGEEATEQWLNDLIANDVTFFGGHTDVRKAVGAGEFKLGLVNHYYYHLQKEEGSPVGIVYPDQSEDQIGLITNATAAAIVKGAHNTAAARAFMDFLISPEGQRLFAELNFEYPLLPGVAPREGVQSLEDFRLVDLDVAKAAQDIDETFDLMERVGLP